MSSSNIPTLVGGNSNSRGGGGGGYSSLCKGLAFVFLAAHLLLHIFPSALSFLALIPSRTIPFAWNLLTAGYLEQTVLGVVVSIIGLLLIGKLLEPIWGSRELMKFIIVVNFLTYFCVFITAISLYYITMQETYLYMGTRVAVWIAIATPRFAKRCYMPLSGFHGVLSGLLVGVKQIIPDQELAFLKLKVKWLPSIILLLSIILSFITTESAIHLPTLFSGTYMGWIYLRYIQTNPETKLKGDPSDEFAFSSFYPEFLRPVIDPVASVLDRLLCRRSQASNETAGYTLGGDPLPGSDPTDASRRRERGARRLEERLAERLANARAGEEFEKDAAENV